MWYKESTMLNVFARWLELFPKILSAIAAQEIVVYAGKDMNGPDYKSHILNSLCSGRWVFYLSWKSVVIY